MTSSMILPKDSPTGASIAVSTRLLMISALPGIEWVGPPSSYAPIEEDRGHARRGAVPGAAGANRAVDGGGSGRGHDGAAGGSSGRARAGAVPVPGVRDGGTSV